MGYLAYAMIAMTALTNAVLGFLFSRQRAKLDLSKPEDAKRDKGLRLLTMVLPAETVVLSLIIYFVVKPVLEGAH